MIKRNENVKKISPNYLFVEVNERKKRFLKENPDAKIINLGIGNTTQPLTPYIAEWLKKGVENLLNKKTYTGYGEETGSKELKEKISEKMYSGEFEYGEILISDGAKCDISRLQIMFGPKVKVAVQDPAYPVYVDGSVLMGAAGGINGENRYKGIRYMPCIPENDFFPDLSNLDADLIYFCSPNNPTGFASSKEQLKELVDYAIDRKAVIVFDAAYSAFIRDKKKPKSIFEIKNAKQAAIELNSLSKSAGFAGVRLGWSVVPKELEYEGKKVLNDWIRVVSTLFNGPSNISEAGAWNAIDKKGQEEIKKLTDYYMNNAEMIKNALDELQIENYGGVNSPYIWARIKEKSSWETFDFFLSSCHLIVTPGSGFGKSGEGFVRISSFGSAEDSLKAVGRIKKAFSG